MILHQCCELLATFLVLFEQMHPYRLCLAIVLDLNFEKAMQLDKEVTHNLFVVMLFSGFIIFHLVGGDRLDKILPSHGLSIRGV